MFVSQNQNQNSELLLNVDWFVILNPECQLFSFSHTMVSQKNNTHLPPTRWPARQFGKILQCQFVRFGGRRKIGQYFRFPVLQDTKAQMRKGILIVILLNEFPKELHGDLQLCSSQDGILLQCPPATIDQYVNISDHVPDHPAVSLRIVVLFQPLAPLSYNIRGRVAARHDDPPVFVLPHGIFPLVRRCLPGMICVWLLTIGGYRCC